MLSSKNAFYKKKKIDMANLFSTTSLYVVHVNMKYNKGVRTIVQKRRKATCWLELPLDAFLSVLVKCFEDIL